MKKKFLVLLMVFVLAFSLFACNDKKEDVKEETGSVVEKKEESKEENKEESKEESNEEIKYGDFSGFLWEVEKDGKKAYLFGSIHMAKNLYPFAEVTEKAFESSDVLGVEADITDMKATMELAPLLSYTEEGDTVFNHLSEEGKEKVNKIFTELNLNPKLFEKFRVWVLGSNLMSLQLMGSEYAATSGVDVYFLNKAKKEGKEIVELEGTKFQIELINAFSDKEQEDTFISNLGTKEETVKEMDKLYERYLSGDEEKVIEYLFSEKMNQGVENKLLAKRNIGMADKIKEYLKTDKTYFVVVGLAHYLGDDSVIKLLTDDGYTVKRLK